MRLGIFAYADTAAVPWGGFFEVPFLGGDNYSPVQAVRYRRVLIKIYHQLTRAHKPERLVWGRSCVLVACILIKIYSIKNRPTRIGLLNLHWLKIRRCAELCRNEGSECKRSSW